jgi:hypothetical protein
LWNCISGKILIESNSKKDGYEKSFTHIMLEFPMDENWFKDLIKKRNKEQLQDKEPGLGYG